MMKLTLTLLLSLFVCIAFAEGNNAIYAWVDGSSTCYKLESMPKVTYVDGSAVLTLNGKSTPELVVSLANGKELKFTYGEYRKSTGLDGISASMEVRQDGKFISGGKLIIVKDGKQYDANGVMIK